MHYVSCCLLRFRAKAARRRRPQAPFSLLKASQVNQVLLVRWLHFGLGWCPRLQLLLVVQSLAKSDGDRLRFCRELRVTGAISADRPPSMAQVVSPPRKVLGLSLWPSSRSRFVALVESRSCDALRLRCKNSSQFWHSISRASFVFASFSRRSKALRLCQLHSLILICSWFATLWDSRHASRWWCCNL
jgi:hypothetical protein